jgi:hypothetical protein
MAMVRNFDIVQGRPNLYLSKKLSSGNNNNNNNNNNALYYTCTVANGNQISELNGI